jgi:hypothetical protein
MIARTRSFAPRGASPRIQYNSLPTRGARKGLAHEKQLKELSIRIVDSGDGSKSVEIQK